MGCMQRDGGFIKRQLHLKEKLSFKGVGMGGKELKNRT